MKKRVLVAMSGGVDSSVAALMLLNRGFDVSGAHMKLYEGNSGCCSFEDASDARSVCSTLGINFYVFDFRKEFKEFVIEKFVESYRNGQTPNPCINCNKHIKFNFFLDKALKIGFDYIATGHYARISKENEIYILKKAKDLNKDQSYVLYNLSQNELSRLFFPISNLTKEEVRRLANDSSFITKDKKESQDICFVANEKYYDFLSGKINEKVFGKFFHINGEFLGKTKELFRYTVGQRRGLDISYNYPLYVISINIKEKKVILGPKEFLFMTKMIIDNINLNEYLFYDGMKLNVKTKYGREENSAIVKKISNNEVSVTFDARVKLTAIGQHAVCYHNDKVVLGGVIKEVFRE